MNPSETAMNPTALQILPVFSSEDQAWLRRGDITVPDFWQGHGVAPAAGDILRIGGRQFTVQTRVWEHDGGAAVLRLYLGDAHAHSDTSFG